MEPGGDGLTKQGAGSRGQGAGSRQTEASARSVAQHPAPRTLHPDSPRRLRVYCAGPMRAGGAFVGRFHEMVRIVEELGHDALSELSTTVEWGPGLGGLTGGADGRSMVSHAGPGVGDDYIYDRDISWLGQADALVAEVSAPSLGVGYEISHAIHNRRIPVLCLVHSGVPNLSAMISGNTSPGFRLERYRTENDMRGVIRTFLRDVAMQ